MLTRMYLFMQCESERKSKSKEEKRVNLRFEFGIFPKPRTKNGGLRRVKRPFKDTTNGVKLHVVVKYLYAQYSLIPPEQVLFIEL